MLRLFIAILPDEHTRGRLYGCAFEAAGGRAVRRENLHMTLVFIGETDSYKEIKRAMDLMRFSPVRINIDRYGCFGKSSQRLLWAGGKADKKLLRLYDELREKLSVRGIVTENRAFVPHITLCRRFLGELPEAAPNILLASDKISLMQSVNENGRTVYKELYSVRATESSKIT